MQALGYEWRSGEQAGRDMRLRELFWSAQRRNDERLKEQVGHERAYDTGRQLSQTIIGILAPYLDEQTPKVARELCDFYRTRISATHKKTNQGAVAEWQAFLKSIWRFKEKAIRGANDQLGEWKYVLIKADLKADFDRYITMKVEQVVTVMEDVARDELMYALVRIRGDITDEEHGMSPGEFKAHRARLATERREDEALRSLTDFIDEFLKVRAGPPVQRLSVLIRERMETTHGTTVDDIEAEWQIFEEHVESFTKRVIDETKGWLAHSGKDLDQATIDAIAKAATEGTGTYGELGDYDELIRERMKPFLDRLKRAGEDARLFAFADVLGVTTDAQGAVTPEEFCADPARMLALEQAIRRFAEQSHNEPDGQPTPKLSIS